MQADHNKTRGNNFKLKVERFRLDVKQKFFTVRLVRHWSRFPKKLWVPHF